MTVKTSRSRTILKYIFYPLAGLTLLVIVCIGFGLNFLYYNGLSQITLEKYKTASPPLSQALLDAYWVSLGGVSAIKMQPTTIYSLFWHSKTFPPSSQNLRLAHPVASHFKITTTQKTTQNHITRFAAALWITQNWTAKQAMTFILNRSYFGRRCKTITKAAQAWFGKPPQKLDNTEAILLVSLLKGPNNYLRKKAYWLKRSNQIFRKMHHNWPKRYPFVKISNISHFKTTQCH